MRKLIDSRNLIFSQGGLVWLDSGTWATNGSGNLYNAAAGTELITNTGFDANTTGWTGVNASLASVAGGYAGNALRITNTSSNGYAHASGATTVGGWVRLTYQHKTESGAAATIRIASTSSGTDIAVRTGELSANWTDYVVVGRATGAAAFARLICVGAVAETVLFDDVSLRFLSLSSTLRLVNTGSPNGVISVSIAALTTGTQAGFALCVDSQSSPLNGVKVYLDGTALKVDKNVAGTWTNLASTATTFVTNAALSVTTATNAGDLSVTVTYNGSQVGGVLTIADASVKNNTLHGLFSTYAGNLYNPASFTITAG